VTDFIDQYGDHYVVYPITATWAHDSRNRAIFPTEGGLTRLVGEVDIPGGDLSYYKLTFKQEWYQPLGETFTLHLIGEVGYGDGYGDTDQLPFFENFFAGGIRSVRGFKDNTLGPRDLQDDPVGGNLRGVGTAEVLMPMPFLKDSKQVRLSVFVDAGNVWDTYDLVGVSGAGPIRISAGVGGTWFSPMGPITVSVAVPIQDEPGDELQAFQFTLGATF
jgi:outer membrane protein insertion porin family